MTELVWNGKYKHEKKQGPVRIALPFQTIETVNEGAQDRQRNLELFVAGRDTEWRNRLIWGDKKYVLPSLLPEFAAKVNLIYIDPPFSTGGDFSFRAARGLKIFLLLNSRPLSSRKHIGTRGASIPKNAQGE